MEERSPFKEVPNIPPSGHSSSTNTAHDSTKAPTRKRGWYAQMTDLERTEHLNNLRVSRQQKKHKLATSAIVNPTIVDETLPQNGKVGQGWYARLPVEKKAAYLEKRRIARQQKKISALGPNMAKLGASSPLVSHGMANTYFIT